MSEPVRETTERWACWEGFVQANLPTDYPLTEALKRFWHYSPAQRCALLVEAIRKLEAADAR